MAPVENHDLEQTVIVVTHPRAKRVGGPQPNVPNVTVLTNALGLEPPTAPVPGETHYGTAPLPGVPLPGNPAPPQRDPGEPRRVWLLDQHPNIHAGMSRRELRPNWDWQ